MSDGLPLDVSSSQYALARLRLMYAKPEHPYYIRAPDYRETSSGVVSLHYLCHVLNLNGREAYICGAEVFNSALKTPKLDVATTQRHASEGKVPIAVYPEIARGNPLNCSVVARVMLNFEGFISGNSMDAAPTDLFFYYAALIARDHGHPEGDLLCLPTIDVELFKDAGPGTEREGCYLYQNRYPLERIDYTQLPADIRLLRIASALTLAELAQLLRSAEVLYTYEWSMTCVIAVLCGCPVLFMPGYGVDQQFLDDSFFGCVGFAMIDQPNALEHARASLGAGLQRYVERTAPFWQQLDVFIEKTQAAAAGEVSADRLGQRDWLRQRYPLPRQLDLIQARLAGPEAPTFSVVVRDCGDSSALARTLDSLAQSLYPRVQVLEADQQQQSATALNGVLAGSAGDWFILVDAGVVFTRSGLLMAALYLLDTPEPRLAVYADEALRLADGAIDMALRPDLNLDLLLAFPASLSRHWLYHRETFVGRGGFETVAGRAVELDYQLRLLVEHGLGCVGHLSEVLMIAGGMRQSSCTDEQAVLDAHLRARGYTQARALELEGAPGRYRIDYRHEQQVSVSILIYLEGQLLHFQRCLESLLAKTAHTDYEVLLIEPGVDDPALLQWLDMLEQMSGRFQILRFMPGQSRAAMCNAAAQEARGDYLAWLDACSVVLDAGWLPALLNHAQRVEVGAVGGKLLAADGSVRQAGVVLGLDGTVGPAFAGASGAAAGYMGRIWLEQNYSAVAHACLMVRRALFLEAGGFDVDPLLAPWIDLDFCLKLHQAGYLNVWTPYARLMLDSALPAPTHAEQDDALYARWLPQLARDPAYNVNFSLRTPQVFTVQDPGLSWRPLQGCAPTVLVCAGDRQSRLVQPLKALNDSGRVDGVMAVSQLSPVEIERLAPSSIVFQRPLHDGGLLAMRRARAFSQAFKVYDLDAHLAQMGSINGFSAEQLRHRMQFGMQQCDRVLVASPTLAEQLRGEHDDIRVLESALPITWGSLQGARRAGARPRLGWLGDKDAELLVEVVRALAGEVEWVVLGECPVALRPFVTQVLPAVGQEQLGSALAAANLDLALVPMANTLANACSGDLRVLQHAACGHPVICSKVPGFIGGEVLPLSRVSNQASEWLRAIRLHLEDRDASAALGDALQASVRTDWLLEGARLEAWRQAWLAD